MSTLYGVRGRMPLCYKHVRSFVRSSFVFKICWKIQFFSEFRLIMPIFIHFFQFFEGSKHAILSKNHRQGSRTWWSRRFYRDKIRSNPQSVRWIWWFFRENLTFWGISKVQFVLPSSIFVSFTSHWSRGVVWPLRLPHFSLQE